jgi:unsaturated rhamnogalacturonyl hydrolase
MNPTDQQTNRLTMPATELAFGLYDHYESIAEVFHYYGLLAIFGLIKAAELSPSVKRGSRLERCRAILSGFPGQVTKHSAYNTMSYRIGGIPRAYALYRGHMTDELTRRYVAHYAEEAMLAPRDDLGLVCNPYRPKEQRVWIDLVMAVTPYLLFAGLACGRSEWVDEAAKQAFGHYKLFLNSDNGLLHQSKGFVGPGLISQDHWGRGNGWGYIALTELVEHLPDGSPHRAEAEKHFVDLSTALLPYQTERGLWRQEIPRADAWEESSGTGLILYGYGMGLRKGLLDPERFVPAFERGIEALRTHCINDDLSTELCCPGCLSPGEGDRKGTPEAYIQDKQPVHDDEHSFGPIMLALTEQARRE